MKQYVFDALQQKHQTARWHNLEDHKADRNYPKHTVWPVATDDSLHRRPAKSETAIKYRVRKKLSEFWKAKAYKLSERCNVS